MGLLGRPDQAMFVDGVERVRELGTTSKVETVNAALAYVAESRLRAERSTTR